MNAVISRGQMFLRTLLALILSGSMHLSAGESGSSTATNTVVPLAEQFRLAEERFLTETNSVEPGWQFARACFDMAVAATNISDRARFAEKGIAVCRRVILRDPDCGPCHYYLGMNLGQLADTKRNLAALKMVDEMEREFALARELDQTFDHAGPDRNLGLLYLQAPPFVSIGSRSKARQHLRWSVDLAPEFPENRLNLIEAYVKWGDRNAALREVRALEAAWNRAREKFSDPVWFSTWAEWRNRLIEAKRKLGEVPSVVESPRHVE